MRLLLLYCVFFDQRIWSANLLFIFVISFAFYLAVRGKMLKMLTVASIFLEPHFSLKEFFVCVFDLMCSNRGQISSHNNGFLPLVLISSYLFHQIDVPMRRIILKLSASSRCPFIHVASFLIIRNNPWVNHSCFIFHQNHLVCLFKCLFLGLSHETSSLVRI